MTPEILIQTLDLLCPDAPVEIRVHLGQRKLTTKRFTDHRAAAQWVMTFPEARAVYTVLNPWDDARINGAAVNDASITRRHWILIDVDPARPVETNATDLELTHALTVLDRVKAFLTAHGWPAPIEALSGNGGHLLYRVDLPNDDVTRALIEGTLKYLAKTFDTPHAHVDPGVFNASRITKLYGTYARKGPASLERPIRLSALTRVVHPLVPLDPAALQRVADLHASIPKVSTPATSTVEPSLYEWKKVLTRVEVTRTAHRGDTTFVEIVCPWIADHSTTDPGGTILTKTDAGAVGFKCQHAHCQDRTWKALCDRVGIRRKSQRTFDTANAILVQGGELTKIVDQAEQALLPRNNIYQRGGDLVRMITIDIAITDRKKVRRDAGSTMIAAVREPWLIEQMGLAQSWLKYDERKLEWKPTDPSSIYARTLMARAEWRFPVLRGVITAPSLTFEGQIIETPGFDAKSGLLVNIPKGMFPPVPVRPTKDDAVAALKRLMHPLRSFPFVTTEREKGAAVIGSAQAVALSGLLAALVRYNLESVPLHGYDAPTAGTGKSILAEIAGLLATGHTPPAMSQGKSDEEDEKRLSSVLYAGDPVIHIDNCEKVIAGDFLCSMLTQQTVKFRVLGKSEVRELPCTVLVLASGNNLTFAGDTSRRAVICRLDAGMERPDTRIFDFNCHEEVRRDRPQLVVDALTILRAYRLAHDPQTVTPMGSFDDYAWIREALVWIGCADPADTRIGILETDQKKDELVVVMDLWDQAFSSRPVEVAQIEQQASKQQGPAPDDVTRLRNKFIEICCDYGKWNGRSVGWWLRGHKDRVVGRRRLRCVDDTVDTVDPDGTRRHDSNRRHEWYLEDSSLL